MRIFGRLLPALFAGALCFCLLLPLCAPPSAPAPAVLDASPVPTAPPGPVSLLFPQLNEITALSVSTPERSFHFHLDHQGAVSVNGSRADHEIFSTLLNQIRELPAEHHSAFAPSAQDLLLTLVISTDTRKHTARFYEDSKSKTARIVLDGGDAPEYRQTNIWRIGTLMMTCEGTRILDAHDPALPIK